jgi:GNAT superfamily N-acetyltransferase
MRFELDPVLDVALRDQLTDVWVEVTNAGGAVGFVPRVDKEDVLGVAGVAFDRVSAGQDHVIVGFEDGVPFGFAFLDHRPGPLFRHWATLKRLMVRPSVQGTGRGNALLEAIHEKARTLALEQIHLTVRGGTGMETFYEKHGYAIQARIPNVIRVAPGDDREEIYMVKHLKPA